MGKILEELEIKEEANELSWKCPVEAVYIGVEPKGQSQTQRWDFFNRLPLSEESVWC